MWLDDLEHAARFVIYETGARHPGWLARSISRADAVILLGRGDGDPAVTAIERLVSREEGDHGAAQRMLVLLHDEKASPSRTAAWLAPRTVARHLHVRLSRPDDVGRVAVSSPAGPSGSCWAPEGRGLRARRRAARAAGRRHPHRHGRRDGMGAAMSAQHAMGWSPERIVQTGRQKSGTACARTRVPRGPSCRSCAAGAAASAAR